MHFKVKELKKIWDWKCKESMINGIPRFDKLIGIWTVENMNSLAITLILFIISTNKFHVSNILLGFKFISYVIFGASL